MNTLQEQKDMCAALIESVIEQEGVILTAVEKEAFDDLIAWGFDEEEVPEGDFMSRTGAIVDNIVETLEGNVSKARRIKEIVEGQRHAFEQYHRSVIQAEMQGGERKMS